MRCKLRPRALRSSGWDVSPTSQPGGRCSSSPTRVTRRTHRRRNLAARARAGIHARDERRSRPPAGARRHSGGADRSRRTGHLSRPRAAGGLPADRRAPGEPRRARPGHGARARGHRAGGALRHHGAAAATGRPASMWTAANSPAWACAIRRGGSYHGLALNVDMDLEPFRRINPCGYAGLEMTQFAALGGPASVERVGRELVPLLVERLRLPQRAPGRTIHASIPVSS